ncbi:hypothetical protein CONCODRAFT_76979 [Conidiobolus coronatus NRRL 28638]|uniref:Endonuclease/exonuclease/phosphatase domain-containing protein n=1 Tax=Conidiobolus coronatus (strain ATCC 28846 / CBS 209.66 / NRRL 28638) TaxID=796925 RepID=A0A137PGI5_CONC2|nr:hypothetical protein CONCODRAFT_76979 [Conidiobolus coronatus NRRL 28638]|eukprot:KXN74098.1 hypothetical protein CONCODRAFT_76979 [Conidiobolus coronatus NRRL 28638]
MAIAKKTSSEESTDSSSKRIKLTKSKSSEVEYPTKHRNAKMPETYEFKGLDNDEQIKLVTYNVASLNASLKKGFKEYVLAENPTIISIQETKLQQPMRELFDKDVFPHTYWSCSGPDKKGYSGTAVLSKIKPLSVKYGLGTPNMDTEGRVITLEFEKFYLVSVYSPNAGDKLVRLGYKEKWDKIMLEHLNELESKKSVIYTGDLNVAHNPIDVAKPKEYENKVAGFTKEERLGFSNILSDEKFKRVDVFRHFNPSETDCYTFFSWRGGCRAKGIGWRLDYYVVSESLVEKVKDIQIRRDCYGASDHLPLVMWLDNMK